MIITAEFGVICLTLGYIFYLRTLLKMAKNDIQKLKDEHETLVNFIHPK